MNHREHWENVRALGCCVSYTDQNVTIHHCHGGSIIDYFGKAQSPGMAQRQNHFLVIPLAAEYHTGQHGIDTMPTEEWEGLFGEQVEYLIWVNDHLWYDIFDEAGVPAP